VYLLINDDRIEIRKAEHLLGKTVHEATNILNAENSAPSENAPVLCDLCKKKKSAEVFASVFGERK